MKISRIILLPVLFCLFSVEMYAWRSSLYPSNWVPGYTDAQGRFLHDFSYAGYMKGEAPIPESVGNAYVDVTQTPYNADNTGVNDATSAIQQAINFVGQSGGGTVYLPEGTYKVKPQSGSNNAISITYSNTSVRLKLPDIQLVRIHWTG